MKQDYSLAHSATENDRLSKQANLLYSGPHFLDRFLANNPLNVLDVACGTGVQSAYAAEHCSQGKVTGVDLEDERIKTNRAVHAKQKNLSFERGDVYRLPFPDESFDLCFCRFLLTHLADAKAAVAEMRRVTKKGGWVVAHELFQDAIWMVPPRPTFEKFFGLWKRQRSELGQDHSVGLRLYGLFHALRFGEVGQEVLANKFLGTDPLIKVYLSNLKGILQTLKAGSMANDISAQDLAQMERELDSSAPSDLCLELTIVASGKK